MITMVVDLTAEMVPILWAMVVALLASAALIGAMGLAEWIKLRRRQNPLWLVWRWWPIGARGHSAARHPQGSNRSLLGGPRTTVPVAGR